MYDGGGGGSVGMFAALVIVRSCDRVLSFSRQYEVR